MTSISISAITSSSATSTNSIDNTRRQMQALMKTGMDAAAKALNMDPTDLQSQLKSGKSLKDVAAAQGVDFSKVQSAMSDAVKPQLDQAVSAGTLTSSQAADLLGKLTSGERPSRPEGAVGAQGTGGGAGAFKKTLDAAAKTLDMSASDLISELRSGKSLKDVATAKGVDFAKVQSAIKDAVQPQLDSAVKSGQLSATMAADLLKSLTSGDVFQNNASAGSDGSQSSIYSVSGAAGASASTPGVMFQASA
jgi:hypothetical protein